ncbi:helix-hairpin-helix domain-containing protein [Streptomyces ochraceiscleroticus]|uniref:Helix-hairpin-helix domain-containing protein n=1 Tax=Streptomyces ochraceiscleroticus TaxID=47761 RepID=A0ABW1MR12_9ACTN|nr:helix-hairpin-helix domain-containing protein [Streptomyces ochraceiscleroticus]
MNTDHPTGAPAPAEAPEPPAPAGDGGPRPEGADAGPASAGGAAGTGGGAAVAGAGAGAGGADGSKASAAALAAAVRAVESGERSAASFFTETPRGPAPTGRGAAGTTAAPGASGAPGAPAGAGGGAGAAPGGRPVANGGRPPAGQGPGTAAAAGPGAPGAGGPARAEVGPTGTDGGPAGGAYAPGTASGGGPQGARPGGPQGPGAQGSGPQGAAAREALSGPLAPGIDGARQVLAAGGAPEALAEKAVRALGEQAGETLREDPWRLLAVAGVRPEQADTFARALLGPECGPGDERRGQALIGWLLEQAALAGHSALEASALRAALAARAVPDPDEALQTAIAEGEVLVFQDALDDPSAPPRPADAEDDEERPVRLLFGLDRFAMAEESVADGLSRLLNTFEPIPGTDAEADAEAPASADTEAATEAAPEGDAEADAEVDVDLAAEAGTDPDTPAPDAPAPGTADIAPRPPRVSAARWDAVAAAAPSSSAGELIRAAAHSGLVAHTGGEAARAEPAALIAAARALGLRAVGATHTADGRRRFADLVTEATAQYDASGVPTAAAPAAAAGQPAAVTLGGLLAGREGPGRDADGSLALDLLVVLDAPQLDLETAALLIESLADGTRLVLSGDPGVLWSAGPGRLFADLLAARCCPQVASRTPDFGPIGELVSGIGIGELTEVEAPEKEVVIVPVRDAGEAVHRTVQLVADSVPRAIGVPTADTQVITVGHGGAAGTRALNAALKERLNPGPGKFGGFDPGDRVAYSPAPGRTVPGQVTGADADGLHLDCGGAPVVVPRDEVAGGALRHGWALTAHQAAGMRWPAAVVVVPGDAAPGLTRAWVYTAFGRGERHLSVVQGADQALPRAVAEIPAKDRTTRLRTLLNLQQAEWQTDAS